jgi:hypothetical protein
MQSKITFIAGIKRGARLSRRGGSLVHFSKEGRFLAIRIGSGPIPAHLPHEVGDARAFEACELYFGGPSIKLGFHIVEIYITAGICVAIYLPQVPLG